MPCRIPATCLCPHVDHDEDECYGLDVAESIAADAEVDALSEQVRERVVQEWLRRQRAQRRAPLSEGWLASVGFKWHQLDRQPNKHWLLWLGDALVDQHGKRRMWSDRTDLGIELSRVSVGEYEPDWHCWLRSDTAHRYHRFIHIRYLTTEHDLIDLVEGLTGQAWDPANHLYGGCLTPEVARRRRAEAERLDLQFARGGRWYDTEKDDTRGGPLLDHLHSQNPK